jgi:putative MATE family efflux protein
LRDTGFLGSEPVGRLLLRLSLPAILGMSVQASYNLVDAFFIGRGVGPMGLAGTAVAFPLQLFVIGVGTMGGVGTASLVSRSLGAGDLERADRALGTLVTLALSAGTAATLLCLLFLPSLLLFLGTTPEILPFARDYMGIILFGIPLQVLGLGLGSVLRAEGNARTAMAAMFVSAAANMVLDALFIFGFGWGISGAAWATVLAQGVAAAWLGTAILSGKSALKLKAGHLVPREGIVGEILAVGASEFAELTAASAMVTVVIHSMARYGSPMAVAAYGVVSRILSMSYLPIFGVAQGLQPILGYNYGAGHWGRARRAILLSILAATVISCGACLVLQLFPGPVFGIFTKDPALRGLGARSLRFMTFGFFCVGFHIIGAGIFQALGKAVPALFLSLSGEVILFLPLVLFLPRFWGLMGVWLSFPLSDILSALVTGAFFLWQMKELRKREERPHAKISWESENTNREGEIR